MDTLNFLARPHLCKKTDNKQLGGTGQYFPQGTLLVLGQRQGDRGTHHKKEKRHHKVGKGHWLAVFTVRDPTDGIECI